MFLEDNSMEKRGTLYNTKFSLSMGFVDNNEKIKQSGLVVTSESYIKPDPPLTLIEEANQFKRWLSDKKQPVRNMTPYCLIRCHTRM